MKLLHRWLRFNLVGAAGIAVQLAVLSFLVSVAGLHYLVATALAVETAVLHNYAWHRYWTWSDRRGSLLRFNLTTGLISILSNVVLMWALHRLPIHYLVANGIAIAITNLANFAAAELFAFRRAPVPVRSE